MNRLIPAIILVVMGYSVCAQKIDTLVVCIDQGIIVTSETKDGFPYIPQLSWSWSIKSSSLDTFYSTTDSVTPPFKYSDTGLYQVFILTRYNNNTSSLDSFYIRVLDPAPPANSLGNDTTYCGSFLRTLNAYHPYSTFLWSPGGQTSSSITVTQPGTYTVEINNKCYSGSFSIKLNQSALPNVNLGEDGITCHNDTFYLNAGNAGSTYLWFPYGQTSQSIVCNRSGTYSVIVTNAAGCTSGDEVVLRDSCPPDLLVPTAFTVNVDGLNETIYPYVNGIRSLKFAIYDRWGEQMFYTEKIGEGWDGTFEGVAAMSGLYIWTVNALDNNGNRHVKNGYFVLLR